MPATTPQVQLNPRHLSSTTLSAQLLNSATQMQVASGAIFDTLPTAALLTDGVNIEIVSVDSLSSGTTYTITRAIEPGTAASTFPANTTQVKLIIAAETLRRLQRGFRERTTGRVNVLEYGAKGDAISATGTITSGQATLNSSNFAVGDVGQAITILGAGAAGATLSTTIASRSSSTVVSLTAPAGTTVTGALATWNSKVSKVSITSGSTTCTLVGPWTSADVGKPIVVQAAGGSATAPLVTTIAGFTSGILVTLAASATSTPSAPADASFTFGTDDTAAIQAALASLSGNRGGRVTLPALTYMLTGTLVLPSHCEFWGSSAGQLLRLSTDLDYHAGTCLVWAGATNTPMVKLFNVQGTLTHGIAVNAENVAGVTGFLLDSDNTISSQQNVVEYWAAWNCPVAFQWGTSNGSTAFQNDTVNLRRFWIAAPTLAATALGIVINTANSQISRIEHGIIQLVNKGIHLQRCGGILTIDRVAGGAILSGSNATFIQTSPLVTEFTISNCQAESCTYFLRALDRIQDADASIGVGLAAITLLTCHLDTPILVTGGQTIITIGCSASIGAIANVYQYNTSGFSGTVLSIGDVLANPWTMTNGTLWQLATFLNGVATPVTNFPYMQIGSGTIVRKHLSATASISTWAAIAQDATDATHAISVPGAAVGDTCIVTPNGALGAGLVWNAQCTTPDVVTIRMTNTAASQTPATVTWRATVLGY